MLHKGDEYYLLTYVVKGNYITLIEYFISYNATLIVAHI